jgi:uncharacterized protein (DUF1778 family)
MIATALNTAEQTLSEERLRTLHDAGRRRLTDIVGIPAADALMRAFTRRPATPNED